MIRFSNTVLSCYTDNDKFEYRDGFESRYIEYLTPLQQIVLFISSGERTHDVVLVFDIKGWPSNSIGHLTLIKNSNLFVGRKSPLNLVYKSSILEYVCCLTVCPQLNF
ncbi:hypothetical protein BpHYR1_007598 [Brachionus plicatilis]|uniref:Uncharacterized protein n=1 Tax=Brachionus plicatilis TaxID=10195 RepID=A0A3M7R1A7_BRAPC|nr:hypothetical protein BpHYR1_007598 [Brachionus plicatilis]